MSATSAFSHSVFARDFNASTAKTLLKKGVRIVGKQACLAYPGDQYFTGIGYTLATKDGYGFIRSYEQIVCMAKSSWCVNDLFTTYGDDD